MNSNNDKVHIEYTPKPIDTTDIVIPEELLILTEKLAENVHEVWAKQRMKEGWSLGDERNDERKVTPCLVPYSLLEEPEKEYDRNTAIETIKVILKLGYEISRRK